VSIGLRTTALVILFAFVAVSFAARESAAQSQVPPTPASVGEQGMQMPGMPGGMSEPMGEMLLDGSDGSGTAWLPAATPMYGIHRQVGTWEVMLHGNAFLQFLLDAKTRGSSQSGSVNWFMAMARRPVGGGTLGGRAMASFEPWTIRGCGYPDLLASGEQCEGKGIYDKQHPHDLFMELAAEYERPLAGDVRWQVYAGLSGEPALGPAGFPHRLSAMPNPLAPIAHHWLDSTHVSFGVVTAGIHTSKWNVEASAFNGREPDEDRGNLDLAALDSASVRLSLAPRRDLVIQVSAGHLREAEAGHDDGEPRTDVDRITASASWHRSLGTSYLATTFAWGRNVEEDEASQAWLVESNLTVDDQHAWFGRLELVGKPSHDLGLHDLDELVTVGKLQAGYVRYLPAWGGLTPGAGISFSAAVVPKSLVQEYGRRVNPGIGVYLTFRPARHKMIVSSARNQDRSAVGPSRPPPGIEGRSLTRRRADASAGVARGV